MLIKRNRTCWNNRTNCETEWNWHQRVLRNCIWTMSQCEAWCGFPSAAAKPLTVYESRFLNSCWHSVHSGISCRCLALSTHTSNRLRILHPIIHPFEATAHPSVCPSAHQSIHSSSHPWIQPYINSFIHPSASYIATLGKARACVIFIDGSHESGHHNSRLLQLLAGITGTQKKIRSSRDQYTWAYSLVYDPMGMTLHWQTLTSHCLRSEYTLYKC